MTTQRVDGLARAASCASPWPDRVGLAAMLLNHEELDSGEDLFDSSDNIGLSFAFVDVRKRKLVFAGGADAIIELDRMKRSKHESFEHSGTASELHSNLVEVFPGQKSLITMAINCILSSTSTLRNLDEQSAYIEAVGASTVDTSYGSTDSYNAGHDEYSKGGTSPFHASDEVSSNQCFHGRFLSDNRNTCDKRRDECWSGGSNLLQFQLGSFIRKERQKLELKFEDGKSGLSKQSSPSPWCGSDIVTPGMLTERSYGLSTNSLSASLCGCGCTERVTGRCPSGSNDLCGTLEARRSFVECSRAHYHGGTLHSSDASPILLSFVRNKKMKGFDVPVKVADETRERSIPSDTLPGFQGSSPSSAQLDGNMYELHRNFVLSSGRPSHFEAVRVDTRASTIDRDFDEYFAKLML